MLKDDAEIRQTVVKPGQFKERLIIFTRYPTPGETKTRLIPVLGKEQAAELHRRMAEKILRETKIVAKTRDLRIEVRYYGAAESNMCQWLGPDLLYTHQGEGNLGDRMFLAFKQGFLSGADRIVLIGTDIPGLHSDILSNAFDLLNNKSLVLGPATDGGYYLIGLRHLPNYALFAGIAWGTPTVLEKTLQTAEEQGLSVALVDTLTDIDRPEDLAHVSEYLKADVTHYDGHSHSRIPDLISVIIPTLNEESNLHNCISAVTEIPDVEVIVVDGGSDDLTIDIANGLGVKVLQSPAGRALQMNFGARHSSGEILVFLHADTRLPNGWSNHVRRELSIPGTAAGAFELRIKSHRRCLRLIEKLANLRSMKLSIPYGDQAIFVKADLFCRIGGFKEMLVMEDFELVMRLKKLGRIRIAPIPALTSGRRWEKHGIIRTTAIHQLIILGYLLGFSSKKLSRLHPPNSSQ